MGSQVHSTRWGMVVLGQLLALFRRLLFEHRHHARNCKMNNASSFKRAETRKKAWPETFCARHANRRSDLLSISLRSHASQVYISCRAHQHARNLTSTCAAIEGGFVNLDGIRPLPGRFKLAALCSTVERIIQRLTKMSGLTPEAFAFCIFCILWTLTTAGASSIIVYLAIKQSTRLISFDCMPTICPIELESSLTM
jgi:hypothetical protein